MPTYDEIFEKVQATLVDALGVDEEDVTREATLQGDLGAESIDFLDIVFRLERNFGIKIPRGELFPENLMADPEWVADGKLTPKGVGSSKPVCRSPTCRSSRTIPPSTGSATFTRSTCSFNMCRASSLPEHRLHARSHELRGWARLDESSRTSRRWSVGGFDLAASGASARPRLARDLWFFCRVLAGNAMDLDR